MAEGPLLLAIDQGTTSTRAIAFDTDLRQVASSQVPLQTMHPRPDWVELDPEEILASVVTSVRDVLDQIGGRDQVLAVGLANQGETVVAWDPDSGRPMAPAVVWQCRRSAGIVERLKARGWSSVVQSKTGLPLDPYYSASKLTWLLEENPAVRAAAGRGRLRLGTVDAWLTSRLDGGDARTDVSTASRTQLLSLATATWDDQLLDLFGIDPAYLPRVVKTNGALGGIGHPDWGGSLSLRAMICDQQAALFGHGAVKPGDIKATYGTGVFVLANAGTNSDLAEGLESSVAWHLDDGRRANVLQGGVFTAGAVLDWIRDDLRLVDDHVSAESAAARIDADAGGVRVLPALAGIGPPWWRPEARLVISGVTGGTRPEHIYLAAIDGIAHSVADVVEAMTPYLPAHPEKLRVDGGITANRLLMQRQADVLGIPVEVAAVAETTALGAAALAGIAAGALTDGSVSSANHIRETFAPSVPSAQLETRRRSWKEFVRQAAVL